MDAVDQFKFVACTTGISISFLSFRIFPTVRQNRSALKSLSRRSIQRCPWPIILRAFWMSSRGAPHFADGAASAELFGCCRAKWTLTPFRRSQIPAVIIDTVGVVLSLEGRRCDDAISFRLGLAEQEPNSSSTQ